MMLNYFLFMAFVVIGLFFGALAACAVMGGYWLVACLDLFFGGKGRGGSYA